MKQASPAKFAILALLASATLLLSTGCVIHPTEKSDDNARWTAGFEKGIRWQVDGALGSKNPLQPSRD